MSDGTLHTVYVIDGASREGQRLGSVEEKFGYGFEGYRDGVRSTYAFRTADAIRREVNSW